MRLWILSNERLSGILMGPGNRVLEMCRHAKACGHEVILAPAAWEGAPPDWTLANDWDSALRDWRPGDLLVVDAHLPGAFLWRLVKSGIPFDLDLYFLAVAEMAANRNELSPRQTRKLRFRWSLRYAMLVSSARRVYVSSREQIASLGALVFAFPWAWRFSELDALPKKCLVLPIGVRKFPSGTSASPYPPDLLERGVILWGGGVWPWFDMDTLLDAFALQPDPDSSPVLFFLSPGNNRGGDADAPMRETLAKAKAKGLLGRNVHVNSFPVPFQDVPGYLEHCWAGILANPDSWETTISWRTRFLDLLAAGRPLLVAGHDPLGDLMTRSGAALQVEAGDSRGLAHAIGSISSPEIRSRLGLASRRLGESLTWRRILSSWTNDLALAVPERSNRRNLLFWAARHLLGF
jgi:glycosyltransferase involved in cell wall biosynthesis